MLDVQVLLVSAPHRDTFGYSMPPPGLLRLGGALERAGVPVALVDGAYEVARGAWRETELVADAVEALRAHADRTPVLAIGLSTMGATLPAALAIASGLRQAGMTAPIWLGGPGVGGIETELLRRVTAIDVIVRGEAEESIIELTRATQAGRSPSGIAGCFWRNEHGAVHSEAARKPLEDLSQLPDMAWHLVAPIQRYKDVTGEVEGLVPIDSGRGCVYDCSFCSIGRWWGRRSRPLPAQQLADEVCGILRMPGAKTAYLCHDLFAAHRPHAVAFCSEMIARGVPLAWEARCRADHLDLELLHLMKRAGCWRVLLGIESGDASVRMRANKAMKPEVDLLRVVKDCATAGIVPILSILLGLPGEGEPELERTLQLAADASLLAGVNLSLHLPNPQPGCALGDEYGTQAVRIAGIQPDMAFGAGETAAEREWIDAHPDLFTTFALLPKPEAELRELHALATTLPELAMRFPRTLAVVARQHGGVLPAWRAWRAHGRSWEAYVRHLQDTLLDECLALEHAQLRCVAGAPQASTVRSRATLVSSRLDLPSLTRALLERTPLPDLGSMRTMALVARGRSVETMVVSPDVRRVLALLDGTRSYAQLQADAPALAQAAQALASRGLVTLGVPSLDTAL